MLAVGLALEGQEFAVNILNEVMIPSINAVYGKNFTFQHDNAPIHTARIHQILT